MPKIDIITGGARRRVWSREEKLSILAAAFSTPGTNRTEITRRANISTGQLYTWRKELMDPPAPPHTAFGFARVVGVEDTVKASMTPLLAPPTEAPRPSGAQTIEIEFEGGKLRLPPKTPAALAAAIIKALRGGR